MPKTKWEGAEKTTINNFCKIDSTPTEDQVTQILEYDHCIDHNTFESRS